MTCIHEPDLHRATWPILVGRLVNQDFIRPLSGSNRARQPTAYSNVQRTIVVQESLKLPPKYSNLILFQIAIINLLPCRFAATVDGKGSSQAK